MSAMNDALLIAALGYAELGWPVLPLHTPQPGGCSCKGVGCSVGKHPRTKHGLSDATTNENQIREWWARWPDANVGILTGSRSGLVVIDLDNKGGKKGTENFAVLTSQFGGLPPTLAASTGTGEHLYFRHPDGVVKSSISNLGDGIDVKADPGYVAAAPSLHSNGKRYQFVDPNQPLADMPKWLLALMTSKTTDLTKVHDDEHNPFADSLVVEEGQRNDTLYKLGCALRGKYGKKRDEISAILDEFNTAKCYPPLSAIEVDGIVASVCIHPADFAQNKSATRLDNSPLYFFPINTRQWFSNPNLAIMNDAQTGQYIRLLAFTWEAGGFLPADRCKLWKLARAKSKKHFERDCDLVLAEFVEVEVDGERKLKHPQLATRYADTLVKVQKKIDAGNEREKQRLEALLKPAVASDRPTSCSMTEATAKEL